MPLLVGRLRVRLPAPRDDLDTGVHRTWSLGRDEKGFVLISDADSDVVLPLVVGREQDRSDVELLTAAARVIQRERLGSDVEVEGQEAPPAASRRLLHLRLDLFFPEDLLSGLYPWSAKGPAAALLFSRLRPLLPGGSDGRSQAERLEAEAVGWEPRPGGGDPYTVTGCLLRQVRLLSGAVGGWVWLGGAALPWGLPSRMTEEPLPPMRPARPALWSLAHLPTEVVRGVLHACDPHTLGAAAASCRTMRLLAADVPPGMKLTLYRHQRAALRWMLEREGPPHARPHPCWAEFRTAANGEVASFWGNVVTGELSLDSPPLLQDVRGGLLCDDPGLGKTITMLSLICRSVGLLPAAPPDKPVEWFIPAAQGVYWLAQSEAASAALLHRSASAATAVASGGRLRISQRLRRSRASSSATGAASRAGSEGTTAGNSRLAAATDATMSGGPDDGSEGGDEGSSAAAASDQPAKRPRRETQQPPRQQDGGCPAVVRQPMHVAAAQLQQQREVVSGGRSPAVAEAAGGWGSRGWVQCDLCQKWRSVPGEYVDSLAPDAPWACSINPDADTAALGCAALQEEEDGSLPLASASGWVAPGKLPGSQANVAHLRQLLRNWVAPGAGKDGSGGGDALHGRASVLRWLCKRQPAELARGPFTVATFHRNPAGFGQLLSAMGFRPSSKERQRRHGHAEGEAWDAGSWERKPAFRSLLPDIPALAAALAAGPEEPQHRIYLSAATLVVVPADLIPHWLQQAREKLGFCQDTAELPQRLAYDFDVVLTSFEQLSYKWSSRNPILCSPLMQIHWLRVILDEGQKIGSLSMTNKLEHAMLLHAERRWIMTGTPTRNASGDVQAPYLRSLLAFLRHEPYGLQERMWREAVAAPFAAGRREGRQRLMQVLAHVMVRASKEELWALPALIRRETLLDFAPEHAASYNSFVDIVRFNLLTSDWYDPDHRESLLAETNRQRAAQTLNNLRLSCNVAGNCKLQVTHKDLHDSLTLLLSQPRFAGLPQPLPLFDPQEPLHQLPSPYLAEGHPLERMQSAMMHSGTCDVCGVHVRVCLFTPCAHLLCVDCASGDRMACVACGEPYRMQAPEDPARLEDNPRPKWAVPQDLIEMQPAYAQKGAKGVAEGEWQASWQETKSTKCLHLLRRLREIGAAPREGGGTAGAGGTEEAAQSTSCCATGVDVFAPGLVRQPLPKAIVFTQFWRATHMELLQRYLLTHMHCAPAMVTNHMVQHEKAEQLHRFKFDPRCSVLLMDKSGSVGHDLSFVHYVFLMEPIADRALESQVVSRAHRMGVTADVTVELLCMRGTLEEAMLQRQLEDRGGGKGDSALAATPPAAEADEGLATRGMAATAAEERAQRNELLLALRPVRTADLADYWSASEDEAGGGSWRGVHVGASSLLPELLASSAQAATGMAEQAADEEMDGEQVSEEQADAAQGQEQRWQQQWQQQQQQQQAESGSDEAAATSAAAPAVVLPPPGSQSATMVERAHPRRTVRFADG